MILEYALELSLNICFNNVKAQKINDSTLKMFTIVLANF